MRFSIEQERPDSPFIFKLLSDSGATLLTSDTYSTRDACTDGIRATIDALRNPESFGIQGDNSIALRSATGALLASGSPMASRQQATEAIADIASEASQTTQFDVTFTTTTTSRRTTSSRPAFQQFSKEELAALYYFVTTSNGRPGFELYQRDEDQLYYFHFNDANGQPVLFGRGFPAGAKRDRRVEAVIRNSGIAKRYEVIEEGNQHYFILKARNGQEIARSKMFASRADAEAAIPYLTESIPTYAEQYIKKRKPRAAGTNIYDFDQVSQSGEQGFESFRNQSSKQHYFHFNDDAGNALLFSQGYSSTKARDNGIRSVIRNASIPQRFESKERDGKYYFILRAGNRQEIAQSRYFSSSQERDRWLSFLLGTITGYAGAYGVSLTSTQTTTQTESFTLDAPSEEPASDDTVLAGAVGGLAGAGLAASTGDGDATADIPEPSIPEEEEAELHDVAEAIEAEQEETARDESESAAYSRAAAMGAGAGAAASAVADDDDEEEGAYAYADDDRGGFRLWLPWIIGLIALALILFWLLSMLDGCGGTSNMAGVDGNDTQQEQVITAGPDEALAETDAEGAEMEASNDASSGSGSTGEPPAPLGPNAAALGFGGGSLEGRIANLLSDPSRTLPTSFELDMVSFPRHSAKLNKSAYDQVDNLVALMKAYPNLKITFKGHIDGTEDDNVARHFMNGENITLSAVRARCLYQKFIEAGVPESQLGYEGVGASEQLVNNNTEANKQKNRRLEVIISE